MITPVFYWRDDVLFPKLEKRKKVALLLFHFPWKWNVEFSTWQINSFSTSSFFLCFPNECLFSGSITEIRQKMTAGNPEVKSFIQAIVIYEEAMKFDFFFLCSKECCIAAQHSPFVAVGLSRPSSNGIQIAGVSVLRSRLHRGISKTFNIDVPSFC